jgi:hypothetical protein
MVHGVPRRPTQADIARLAGVSQATVSLVLNERDTGARISPETRDRVLAVMREWGYVANASARSLAGGRNRIIGVYTFEPVFPTTSVDFYFPFLLGMEQEAAELGHDLLLFTSVGGERRMYRDGATRLTVADGALLLGRNPNVDEIERLRDSGYPFVYVGHREVSGASVSYVAADYTRATRELTERLWPTPASAKAKRSPAPTGRRASGRRCGPAHPGDPSVRCGRWRRSRRWMAWSRRSSAPASPPSSRNSNCSPRRSGAPPAAVGSRFRRT